MIARPETLPPRLLAARAAAYAFDLGWVCVVFALALAAVNLVSPVRFVEPSFLNVRACAPADIVPRARLVALLGVAEGPTYAQTLCIEKRMALLPLRTLTLSASRIEDNRTVTRFISYHVDAAGNQIDTLDGAILFCLAFPLLMARFLARGGNTPGKSIAGLRVTGDDGARPAWRTALRRELMKNLPLLALAAMSAVGVWLTFGKSPEDLAAALPDAEAGAARGLTAAALIALAMLWWLLGSFVNWRGKAYWDRMAGTRVESTTRDDDAAPAG